ncbi:hypothetical protein CYY_003152 [Polysphondylium violaceum]|uniref:Leucine-rich repeat-containing protein n=1 Tax=Polysphondylium violaceum TaxID=133409 RepID=A0A8J4Q772_9MYCE|nr:hypothetical protein CYY_003152 [Polysphondylium violaceum]
MASSELSTGEKRFIFELEGCDPDFVCWVKKTNKKDVVQDRLLVFTKYRIYSIKRNKVGGKKQVQRQGHLYDLVEIRTDDIDKVVLKFTTFNIDISGPTTGTTIPKLLINAFHRISFTFSQEALPSLVILPPERAIPEIEQIDPGLAHGFVEVYKAQCNYYASPVNNDLIYYIEDTVSKGSRVFCLDDFAGIDKNSETAAINLVPVLAALRHNTFFDTFICHNKTRKELPALLADVFHHNTTIVRVDLQGIDADDGWVQLGDALKDNQSNNLCFLNISDNNVQDKGMNSIATAIRNLSRPFGEFIARNVGMEPKGASVFFRTLQANYASSGTITKMDFSNNKLDKMGSESLHDWIVLLNSSIPNPRKPLVYLNVENTQLDTAKVTSAIRQANVEAIEYLNLSNNRFTPEAVQNLCTIISKCDSLANIKLRHCGITGEQVTSIISACSSGVAVADRVLDLSDNNLEQKGALLFANTIKTCTNVSFLKLAQNSFRKKGMTFILQALEENTTLSAIDLSSNFKSSSKAESIVDHLARVVHNHPSIRRLVLAGKDRSGFFLGKELLPLVKSLNEDCKLVELDISGNSMGDDICRELFEALKKNVNLKSLVIDDNALGIAGFQAMKRCFTTNRSLVDIPVPTTDIMKMLSTSKDKKATNDKIGEILADVQTCLSNNKNGIAYTDIPSSTKTTVAISSSTPSFRASTYSSNNLGGDDYSNHSSPSYQQPQYSSPSYNNNRASNYSGYASSNHLSYSGNSNYSNGLAVPPPPPTLDYPPPPPPAEESYYSYSNHNESTEQQYTYDEQPPVYDENQTSAGYDESAHYEQPEQPEHTETYDQSAYDQSAYDQSAYDQSAYDQSAYDQSAYDQSAYDQSNGYDDYDEAKNRVPPPPPM